MTKPLILRLKDGREVGVDSLNAKVRKLYPDAKVVSYQDGTEYEEPKKVEPKPEPPKDEQ